MLLTKPSADQTPSSESYHSFQLPAVPEMANGQPPQQATTTVHDTVVDVAVSYYHNNGEAAKPEAEIPITHKCTNDNIDMAWR
jgi:hypothetical protein